jgi:hypothetical protein
MGLIFKDTQDEQAAAMYEQIHLGNTWQWRYARIKWGITTAVATACGVVLTAVTDYCIVKFTEHAGIVGWLLG